MLDLSAIIKKVNSDENKKRIKDDYDRYTVYNGKLKEVIATAIQREFILPETVNALISRVVPINIVQKIINKLAAVYRQSPMRYPIDGDEIDQESLDFYVEEMEFDRLMKHANRMFKLHKNVLLEPYVCKDGAPEFRVLPSHTFTPYSDDPIEPNEPTAIVKHLYIDEDLSKSRYAVWSDEEHWIIDGEGRIVSNEMELMGNPNGINPYGKMPFVYIKDSDDLLIPQPDDDLISMQICISLLLTDLAFASKYQAWSLIYLIGVDNQKISFNPNSVITLPHTPGTEKPEIGVIKPQLDSDALLRQVEALVALLLTTKNLSVNAVSAKLDVSNMASGIALMVEGADTTEDRQDQIAFFEDAEKEFWELFTQNILPVWVKTGQLIPEYVKPFSEKFELGISFPDMQTKISPKEQLDMELSKLNNGLTSKRDVLKALNPELTDFEIDGLLADISKEKVDSVKQMQKQIGQQPPQEPPQDNQQLN